MKRLRSSTRVRAGLRPWSLRCVTCAMTSSTSSNGLFLNLVSQHIARSRICSETLTSFDPREASSPSGHGLAKLDLGAMATISLPLCGVSLRLQGVAFPTGCCSPLVSVQFQFKCFRRETQKKRNNEGGRGVGRRKCDDRAARPLPCSMKTSSGLPHDHNDH